MDQMRPTLDEFQEPPSSFNYSLLTFCSLDQPVLIDCGADAAFMVFGLAKRLKLTPVSLNTSALDARLLCKITHRTTLITLTKLRYSKDISFHFFMPLNIHWFWGFPGWKIETYTLTGPPVRSLHVEKPCWFPLLPAILPAV